MSVVDVSPVIASPSVVGVVSASDPGSSRLVYAMVIGLVVIGVALIVLAIWILRQTRPDLDVLAPLERMGDGDWKRRDPSTQRRMLDEVRPEGARPLASEPPPPPVDADFEADHPVTSFSDLGPGLSGEQRDPTPTQAELDPELAVDVDADVDADTEVDDASEIDEVPEAAPETESDPVPDTESDPVPDIEPATDADVADDVASPDQSDDALSDPRA